MISCEIIYINPLPPNKISGKSKFKVLADNKINVTEKLEFVLGGAENIFEKGENAGYQHFLLSQNVFKSLNSSGLYGKDLTMFGEMGSE